MYSSVTSTQLLDGDVVTITFASVSSRKAAILSAWSDATSIVASSSNGSFGDGGTSVGAQGSSTSATSTTSGVGSGLVVAAFSRAGGATTSVTSPAGLTEVATVTTAAGSSDRGLALYYYTSAVADSQSATVSLSATQGWASMIATYDAVLNTPVSVLPGGVIVGGVKKNVVGQSVIIGGVKKTVVGASVIIGGVKKPLV